MIWQTLVHTPWWVYLILIYCIHRGLSARHTRVVDLRKAWILPALFVAMGIHTLADTVSLQVSTAVGFTGGLAIGVLIGYAQFRNMKVKAADRPYCLQVPGSWSSLVMMLGLFAVKYYFGFERAVNPQIAQSAGFRGALIGITAVLTGWFLGRYIMYIIKLKSVSTGR